jgi:Zn-dependent protease with chaperone function
MELSVFERTAERAEKLAERNFSLYKFKLILFALLGYFVIFGTISLAIGSLVGIGYLAIAHSAWVLILLKNKIIFLVIPVIWVLLKACWVKIEAPTGFELSKKQYPELFAEINAIRKQLRAPKIHKVILTQEMNAGIAQTPRLGIFGWQKNTLVLGMELLLILSTEQTRSVIAHEFGHLSGNHSRFNGWIYRIRTTWIQIMQGFDQQKSWGGKMMAKFFDFYAPRFAAYSFVLARANEYEADNIAAEITSRSVTGEALVNTYVVAPYIENNYWQDYLKLADDNPEPIHMPWAGLRAFLNKNTACPDTLAKALEQELKVDTQLDNTHPALSDRLKSIGYVAEIPHDVDISAAKELLADNYSQVLKDLDEQWLTEHKDNWKSRYAYVQESRNKLRELKGKPFEDMPEGEHWDFCCLTDEFISNDESISLIQEFQKKYPESPNAAYVIGRKLFEEEKGECIQQFEVSVKEPSLVIESCQMAYQFLQNINEEEQAENWKRLAEDQIQKNEAADQEREELSPNDKIHKSLIDEDMKNQIITDLMANETVKSAWLAEKEVKYYKETPMLAIAVKVKGMHMSENTAMQSVHTQMDIDATYIIVPHLADYKPLCKKIMKEGERLF